MKTYYDFTNYKYKWQLTDLEREEKGCRCSDCGLEYGIDFPDMIIPDKLWEKINPTYHKGAGLLCPTCIANRLDFIDEWYEFGCVGLYYQTDYRIFRKQLIRRFWIRLNMKFCKKWVNENG